MNEENYITAEQASRLSDSDDIIKQQLDWIFKEINDAIKLAKHCIYCHHSLNKKSIEKLKELGYEINSGGPVSVLIISW